MSKVIGVRFKEGGKIYYFDPLEFEIKPGDGVVVDTSRGIVFGDVAEAPHMVPDEQLVTPGKRFAKSRFGLCSARADCYR